MKMILVLAVAATLIMGGMSAPAALSNDLPSPEYAPGEVVEGWFPGGVAPTDPPDGAPRRGTMIPGYGSAQMNAGDMALRLTIGNPLGNHVGFIATLMLEDGTELYTSSLLEPGQAVPLIPLNHTLERGEYAAQVVYSCVTLDEKHAPLNAGVSGFTLYVD